MVVEAISVGDHPIDCARRDRFPALRRDRLQVRGAGLYLPSVPPVGDVLTKEDGTALVVERVAPLTDGSYILVLSTRPN